VSFADLPPQPRVQRFLQQLVRKGQVPHAMMFCGMGGVGKAQLAKEFFKLLNCDDPKGPEACGRCAPCHKVDVGTHPDLLWIQPETSIIKIDQIREVKQRLRFRPHEARWRAIVIDGAHNLKDEAGNALLKILEDPPPRNLFLLLTPESQMVLPTLVSRCCRVQFQPLPDEWIAGYLASTFGMPADRARSLARRSDGSRDRARSLAEENQSARQREVLDRVRRLASPSMMNLFDLTADWAQKTKDLEQDLECVKFWVREVLLEQMGVNDASGPDSPEDIGSLARRSTREGLLEVYDTVELAMQHLRLNTNKLLTLEGVCLAIQKGLYGQGHWNSLS